MGILTEGMESSENKDTSTEITQTENVEIPFEEKDYRFGIAKENPDLVKFLDKYPDAGTMAKNYATLEKKWRSENKIVKPGEGATEEDFQEFYKSLGMPERDSYELDYNIDEGNKDLVEKLKDAAHKSGIMPGQLKEVMSAYDNEVKGLLEAREVQMKEQKVQQFEEFKNQLGDKYDSTINKARFAAQNLLSKEELSHFEKNGIADDPAFIMLLSKAAENMAEDSVFKGDTNKTLGVTPEQAQEQINQIMQDKAFFDKNDPKQKMLADKVKKLGEIAARR